MNKDFDWKFYLNNHSDLKEVLKNNKNIEGKKFAYNHWKKFGKREGRICNAKYIKISNKYKNLKVAVLTCTNRKNFINNIINNFTRQTWEHKKMFLCLNNNKINKIQIENKLIQNKINYEIIQIDEKKNLGYCLNKLINLSKLKQFDYCTKFDDDDIYMEKYIEEQIEQAKKGNVKVIGKFKVKIYYPEENKIYDIEEYDKENSYTYSICGSTITFEINEIITKNIFFDEKLKVGTDKEFLRRIKKNNIKIRATSSENYIWVRYKNKKYNPHTWKDNIKEKLKLKEIKNYSIKYSLNNCYYNNYFNKMNIFQICVSPSLQHLEERIKLIYNLNSELKNDKNTLFFGIYDINDYNKLKKFTGNKFIMPGGSELDNNTSSGQFFIPKLNELKDIKFLAISKSILNRLDNNEISSELINLNLVDHHFFIPCNSLGDSIYVYDGLNKKDYTKKVYGEKYYSEIIKRFPNFNFIFSSDLKLPNHQIPEIYKKCFIGLRLTENDGNANTVQEFEAMEIPIIHNQSGYGLKWTNIDNISDIINTIYLKKEMIKYKNKHIYNFYNQKLDDTIINNVIEDNNNLIKILEKFNNILIISSDYPGYGGAATNCHKISNYLRNKSNVFELYFTFKDDKNKKNENNDNYCIIDEPELSLKLKNFKKFKPDIIILKSALPLDINDYFKCPNIFLIPGIFRNNLDKYFYNLKKNEINNYINKNVINQIECSDYSFSNSNHTKKLLEVYFNLNTYLFYSSFIDFSKNNNIKNFEDRKYEYGLIVSDCNRIIKNVQNTLKNLKGKVLLIGHNHKKYIKMKNLTCLDFIKNEELSNYYQDIKYIINNSYFESCSNVLIEAYSNGCLDLKNEYIIKKFTNFKDNINLKKNKTYIICRDNLIFNDSYFINKLNSNNSQFTNLYFVKNKDINDIVLVIKSTKDYCANIYKLIKSSNIKYENIGKINCNLTDEEFYKIFYIYGQLKLNLKEIGLSLFYEDYTNNLKINRSYNKKIFYATNFYHQGFNKNEFNLDTINKKLKFINLHKKKCIFISKTINSYGGNQKSGLQIIHLLDHFYDVTLLHFSNSDLLNDIPKFIIKNTKLDDIIKIVESNEYSILFNNKLNEILNYSKDFSKYTKIYVLTHNSMDPFNKLIIENEKYIHKIFTINNFTKELFYNNGIEKVSVYKNHIDYNVKIDKRNNFKYKIVFLGRLSAEKNLIFLIDTFLKISNQIPKLKLYIIGDGNKELLKLASDKIIFTGKLNFSEIKKHLFESDYLVLPSLAEGLPFCILEAMSLGIPCISSNIVGVNQIIINKQNGYLFNIEEYDKVKNKMNFKDVFKIFYKNYDKNIINFADLLIYAYSTRISRYNMLSQNSYDLINKYYLKDIVIDYNKKLFNKQFNKKIKLFINFKPNKDISYGGGNIFTSYLSKFFEKKESIYKLTFELEDDINIYLVIDPFKDNKFKMYSLDDIIEHKNIQNKNGFIICRINDCDRTRNKITESKSREVKINKSIEDIDFLIYNSNFIKKYFYQKYNNIKSKNSCIIHNGCDQKIFKFNKNNDLNKNEKIKIVTHHWSDNLFKGYQIYYDIWNYCRLNPIYEFVFIGRNIPSNFDEIKKIGPYHGKQLNDHLNDCHIYVSDSKYDSCPNHILEAISCGLPILYTSCNGGGKELVRKYNKNIGESYNHFEDLVIKLKKIKDNYKDYKRNLKLLYKNYDISQCQIEYYNQMKDALFSKIIFEESIKENDNYIFLIENNLDYRGKIIVKDKDINLLGYTNCIIFNYNSKIDISNEVKILVNKNTPKNDLKVKLIKKDNFEKISNDYNLNILLSSDCKYFVGLFANLKSIFMNTNTISHNKFNMNFLIPIQDANKFTKLLLTFEDKMDIDIKKTMLYIDENILDPIIFKSKCYNGGNHLLNISNFSRLLIGEFFNYKKLLYLDSDSIVNTDLYKKLKNIEIKYDIYSFKMDMKNEKNNRSIVLTINNLINTSYDWEKVIGTNIDKNEYAFMGAPFLTDCTRWKNIYKETLKIIDKHNKVDGGLYKLFTMSLQNILFYNKSGDLKEFLITLPDLGSNRKDWTTEMIKNADILDWSGLYKPWYKNGLHKKIWKSYEFIGMSKNFGIVEKKKNTIESFNTNDMYIDSKYIKFDNTNNYLKANEYISKLIENSGNKKLIDEIIKYGKIKSDTSHLKNKFKILYFVNLEFLIRKMSRVRFWPIEELVNRDDVSIFITGLGLKYYINEISIQKNINGMNINFDFAIFYKPLENNLIYDEIEQLKFPICMRYNEMWDDEWTIKEIINSKAELIICHHLNDYEKYNNKYKDIQFEYNPHHANENIFKKINLEKDIDILIAGVTKEKHYPLKARLLNLINKNRKTKLKEFKIKHLEHPGYWHDDSFTNKIQKNYANLINRSKICITCTSKHKYRLGKYVEIPMCGGVIFGDLPYEDKESFKEFVIEVNNEMTDDQILNKLIISLKNKNLLERKGDAGYKWAKQYTTVKYCDKLIDQLKNYKKLNKIYIISDEIKDNHPEFKNQRWICDILKQDFINKYPDKITLDASKADIIWYLASWNIRHIPAKISVLDWFELLENKKVIFSMHHIDEDKLKEGKYDVQLNFMKKYGNKYHAICQKTLESLEKIKHNIKIEKEYLWYDPYVFYYIPDKISLRRKFKISESSYLIGSFQKDTEGNKNDGIRPKLSKGPDLFVQIIRHMYTQNKNIEIVLTGLRREYIIKELEKLNIKYYYFNMISLKELNELYNCLDLYIVSSRYEGGPRSIFEAGATKTPIISTRVGIANELLPEESLFDMNNIITYRNAIPNVEYLYRKVSELKIDNQIDKIKQMLLS